MKRTIIIKLDINDEKVFEEVYNNIESEVVPYGAEIWIREK